MASGTGGVGPGAGIPLSTEWLQTQKKLLKQARLEDATEAKASDLSEFSKDAQKLSSTKDERMLQAMREELSDLNPESETFLKEATEKLIDSVIEQEYGTYFKKKQGYLNLQEKLVQTVLDNPTSREALEEFFDLLLMTDPAEDVLDRDEDEGEDGSHAQKEDEDDPQDDQAEDQ